MLGSTAKAIVKTVQSDTAANKLATQGLRFTSGASLTSLLADAEKGSKSANNALKAAVKEAPDHMVFDTADPSEKVRQLVYNKYKTGGEITAPKVSTSSKLWKGFLGMCVFFQPLSRLWNEDSNKFFVPCLGSIPTGRPAQPHAEVVFGCYGPGERIHPQSYHSFGSFVI